MFKLFKILLCITFSISCTPSPKGNSGTKDKFRSFQKALKDQTALGLDVRTQQEFDSNGSPKALHIPISELSQRMNELDKSKKILVFCEAGGRASKAAELLRSNGFTDVVNIIDWRTWNKIVH